MVANLQFDINAPLVSAGEILVTLWKNAKFASVPGSPVPIVFGRIVDFTIHGSTWLPLWRSCRRVC